MQVSKLPVAVQRFTIGAVAFSALLCVLSIVVQRDLIYIPISEARQYFNMASNNANLPAWWSTVLLLSGALAYGLAGFAARTARARTGGVWFLGAAILAVLSLGEHTGLHHRLVAAARQFLGDSPLTADWMVLGAVVALGLVATLVLIGKRVGGRSGALLASGGLVLLGSAIVGQVVGRELLAAGRSERGWAFLLTSHAGELGENIGAILLLVAALSMLVVTQDSSALRLHHRGAAPVSAPGVTLRWQPAWKVLLAVSLVLSAISLTVVLLAPRLGPEFNPWRLYFDVLIEDNLPTWFSAGLLFTTALAHALVGIAGRMARVGAASGWFVTATLLGVMALDDQTQLHERSEKIGRLMVSFERYPFAWLIPGAIAGAVVAAAIMWLALQYHGRTRWLLITGITVLFASALGLEVVQGFFMAAGNENLGFRLTYHVEELGENIGALLLLAAALSAVSFTRENGGIGVRCPHTPPLSARTPAPHEPRMVPRERLAPRIGASG